LFSRFWPCTRGDRLRLLGGGLLSLVLTGAELGTVVIFEAIVGRVLETRHLAGFWALAGAWLAIAAAGALAMTGSKRLSGLAAGRVQLRLRDSVFSRAQRLPADYVGERRLGDLLIRLTDDVAVVENAIASGPVTLVTSAVSVLAFAAAALVIRWDLALVAFAAGPAFWLLARGFSGPARRAADAERAASGSLASTIEESLGNQVLIQAFNRQDAEAERLHRAGVSWLRATMAETRLDSLYEPLVYFLETCCVLLVFAVGAWDVAGGRLSLAGLLAFAACLAYLYPPVQSLSGLVLSLSEASASAARLGDILGARPAVTEEGSALRGRLLGRGRIDVEAVTFGYPGGGQPVLDRLSFTAAPGRLLAVTGPSGSGSGKSTVARLLLRFRDPDAGRILLDGIDLRELSLRTLRYNVTLLTQEALLFPSTVADNIRYGRSGASEDEIAAAARAADAHAFITALPDGYDTPVGQRGRLLSGGQRQRICLARAFLRDAPVLVLDEPTTGLDPASAQRLLAVIRRFAASHTVILITHDPRLTAAADTVLRLAPPSAQSGQNTSPRADVALPVGSACVQRPGAARGGPVILGRNHGAGGLHPAGDLRRRAAGTAAPWPAEAARPAEQEEPELPGGHELPDPGQRRLGHRTAEPAHRHDLLPGRQDVRRSLRPGRDREQVPGPVPVRADVPVELLLAGAQAGAAEDPAARAARPGQAARPAETTLLTGTPLATAGETLTRPPAARRPAPRRALGTPPGQLTRPEPAARLATTAAARPEPSGRPRAGIERTTRVPAIEHRRRPRRRRR